MDILNIKEMSQKHYFLIKIKGVKKVILEMTNSESQRAHSSTKATQYYQTQTISECYKLTKGEE